MDKYTFTGHLYPPNQLDVVSEVRTDFTSPDGNFEGKVNFQVNPHDKNEIVVIVEASNYEGSIGNLKNSIQVFVNGIIDASNYYNGMGVEARLYHCTHRESNYEFITGSLDLKGAVNDRVMSPGGVIKALHKSEYLLYALSNFRKALKYSEDKGFFCYRCVETMKQYFAHITGLENESRVWETLRLELKIDRTVLDYIKGFADGIRHGDIRSYSDFEGQELLEYTVKILDRFILYTDNKDSFLSKEFAELTLS